MIRPAHFENLDGLRAMAAWIVVFSHMANVLNLKYMGFGAGQIGVMIFFALSGFLMSHVTLNHDFTVKNVTNFYTHRFSRVFPLYLFAVLVSLALYNRSLFGVEFKFFDMNSWNMALSHVLMLKGNSVLWTIPIEIFFYALFPLLWKLRTTRYFSEFLLILLLVDVHFERGILFKTISEQIPNVPQLFKLIDHIHYFLVGILAYQALLRLNNREFRTPNYVFGILFVCIFLSYPNIYFAISGEKIDIWNNIVVMVFIFGIIIASTTNLKLANLILGNRIIRYFGKISFSIYLIHVPVMDVAQQVVGIERPLLFLIFVPICTIAISHLTYHLVESTCRTFINARLTLRS